MSWQLFFSLNEASALNEYVRQYIVFSNNYYMTKVA
jgi:hypothetical protein